MKYSLNEIQSLAKKAARGAGFDWGLAEEAGVSVRWLCSLGLDGVGVFADLLGSEAPNTGPVSITEPDWHAQGDASPVLTAAALMDSAERLKTWQSINIKSVSYPVLMAFAAVRMSRTLGCAVSMRWSDADIIAGETGDVVLCRRTQLMARGPFDVTVSLAHIAGPITAVQSRGEAREENWNLLERFAHRTYAPATEESRLLGAGGAD